MRLSSDMRAASTTHDLTSLHGPSHCSSRDWANCTMLVPSATSEVNEVAERMVGSPFDALMAVINDVRTQMEQLGSNVAMLGMQMRQLEARVEKLDCGYGIGAGHSAGSGRGAAHFPSEPSMGPLTIADNGDLRDGPTHRSITAPRMKIGRPRTFRVRGIT